MMNSFARTLTVGVNKSALFPYLGVKKRFILYLTFLADIRKFIATYRQAKQ